MIFHAFVFQLLHTLFKAPAVQKLNILQIFCMSEFHNKTSNYAVTVGQFGEVYMAQMGSTAVAVKIVKQYSSKKVMEQFEREMSICLKYLIPTL